MAWNGVIGSLTYGLRIIAFGRPSLSNRSWYSRSQVESMLRQEYGRGVNQGFLRGAKERRELRDQLLDLQTQRSRDLAPGAEAIRNAPSSAIPLEISCSACPVDELFAKNARLEDRLEEARGEIGELNSSLATVRSYAKGLEQYLTSGVLSPPGEIEDESRDFALDPTLRDFYRGRKVVLLGPNTNQGIRLRDYFANEGIDLIVVSQDKQRQYLNVSRNADLVVLAATVSHSVNASLDKAGVPTVFAFATSYRAIANALSLYYLKNRDA